MKRACDSCIERKLKCDGGHPCTRCQQGGVQECRFLKPVLKRGPKGSGVGKSNRPASQARKFVPTATLKEYIIRFEESLYAVWPILDAACLSGRLEHADQDIEAYVLALALSAATASQLQLPVFGPNPKVDAAYLASQTVKGRSLYDYREEPSLDAIRTSFFLHVYHATLLKFHSSMIFLQEAIAFAKLLDVRFQGRQDSRREELDTLLTLLWITERGYSFQCGYAASSCLDLLTPRTTYDLENNSHKRDLLVLQDLFASFQIDTQRRLPLQNEENSFDVFRDLQSRISAASENLLAFASARYVDFLVTKHWMRVVLWQSALSQGFLSVNSPVDSMRYSYPGQIMRDLLHGLPEVSKATFVAGGQDQLLKLFEIANSFADFVICFQHTFSDTRVVHTCCPTLLLKLYGGMSPCLDKYPLYRNILYEKLGKIGLGSTSPTTDRLLATSECPEPAATNTEILDNEC